jgi:two-component sensor histidine kinase
MNLLRRIPKPVLDWALPLILLPWTLSEVAAAPEFADPRWLALVCAVGFLLPFGFRRRWPLGSIVVAWSFCAVGSLAVASFFYLQSPFALTLYSAYIAGTTPKLNRSLAGLATTLIGLSIVNATNPEAVPGDYFFPGGFLTAMWLGARTIHNRTLPAAELHEAAAAAAERREIAAARAVEAAVRIEATGRAALSEMRRLLGLLGAADGDAAFQPQPTLDAIGPLIERANAAGLQASLNVDGDPRPLPAGAEVAAYRVVQEALTNTLKHAGAAQTDVLLRWHPDALEIVVADRGPVPGRRHGDTADLPSGGHGIVGMRERVKVYGGELSANPRPDGGFVVRARIPLVEGALVAA